MAIPELTDNRSDIDQGSEAFDTIVIGGGQTGLMVGQELKKQGADFVILNASRRAGDAWRNRWDSLMLFTPARMNSLPGFPFPAKGSESVSKDSVADYLDEYARRLDLPIRNGMRVERLWQENGDFIVTAGNRRFRASNVVVAMADFQVPKVPSFAPDLDPDVVQMHSTQYKNPSQLQDGDVLVVGLGNSGADIALEVAQTRRTLVAGTESGHVPFRIESRFGRWIGVRLVRFAAVRVLNTSTPIGRRARPKMLTEAAPLVRVRPKDLVAAGVERVQRIAGVDSGLPVTEDGQVLDVANVIWCTGYKTGFSWIDLPVFDNSGIPIHHRGIAPGQPGMYFVGLAFLHALWSETLTGVQPDARYVVEHLLERSAQNMAVASSMS
jgi:putative flavoprotein involved in K+ transport